MTAADTQTQVHVLVAEDDESLRALVTTYLSKKGYRVTSVADGDAALAALAEQTFDLVLLDVMMPGKTGFEVLAAARARADTTPILMATALAKPEEIVRALEGGADDYLTKPYPLAVMAARIALRLRLRPKERLVPVPPAHTLDIPIDVQQDGAAAVDINVDDDAIVATEGGGAAVAAFDERSLFSRLRAAADVFKKRKPDAFVDLAPGARLAERYELKQKIGEGGFGVVFQARHLDLQQDVAVKLLRPGTSQSSVEAFRREAQNASRVRHDHAVRVLDFGLENGVAFLVMELLNGRSAEDEVLAHGALEIARACTIAKSTLGALAAAHAQGIVHRDVKPQNIVLHHEREREVPKLLDFGIAKSLGESDAAGVILGSAAYIAPERLMMRAYDGRADVYSLGIVLYRLLTGRLPFAYALDDFEPIARFHLHEAPPAPSSFRSGLSSTIDRAILRLLAKEPDKRPAAEEAETLVEQLVWDANLG